MDEPRRPNVQGPKHLVFPLATNLILSPDHTMLSRPLCIWRASFSPSDFPQFPLTRFSNRIFEILMAVDGLRARNIIQLAGVAGPFSRLQAAKLLNDPW